MTTVSDQPAAAAAAQPTRGLIYRLSALAKCVVVVALALTPFTGFLVLGWLARLMRREAVIAGVRKSRDLSRSQALGLMQTDSVLSDFVRFPGWWSGLWRTVVDGLRAVLVVAALIVPFGLILLIAWWAGWENSFNKGYEQAWVGPLLGLTGVGIGIALLSHLPMAFAHFAAEGRVRAAFDLGVIRRLIRAVRWRYVLLTLATVLLSAPLYLAQILPTFMEKINPALINADAATAAKIAFQWHLGATIYLVTVLIILRKWAARLYGQATIGVSPGTDSFVMRITRSVTADTGDSEPTRRGRIGGLIAGLITVAAWLGFFVMLYIAQFANHAWWNWVNHPIVGLPWVFRPL